jgi:hypothetical protein
MRLRWIVFIAIVLCLIGGLIAGVNSHAIEAALTSPGASNTTQGYGASSPAHGTTGQPPQKPTQPAQPASPTPVQGNAQVLAKDTFMRAAQALWGTASDGRVWTGDANSIEIFSITQGVGQINAGQGAFNAILGPTSADTDIVFSATVNHFAADGTVNIGAALRWTDGNNWYKALIDGTQIQILSRVRGTTHVLATAPFAALGGVSYTLRFRALGANLLAKAWRSDQPEPATWTIMATDTSFSQGMGGIRVLLQSTTVVRVTSFLETAVGAMA